MNPLIIHVAYGITNDRLAMINAARVSSIRSFMNTMNSGMMMITGGRNWVDSRPNGQIAPPGKRNLESA